MKIDFVKLLSSYGVKALTGLAGWQAWLINLLVNRLWKKNIYPAIARAWNMMLETLRDNKALSQYENTLTQGKDADEEQKLKDQLNLLNPPKP